MKHAFPGIALLLLVLPAGCGSAELPPIELDGPGGPRLMTGAGKTPEEAYEFAYAYIHPSHNRVKASLDARYSNRLGAEAGLEKIIESLQSMRSLVTPAFQAKFDPYLARYRAWLREVQRDTWGGSFLSDLDQAEREIKSGFALHRVELISDLGPAKPAPAPPPTAKAEPPPAPPAAQTPPPSDKADLPPGAKTEPAPAPPAAPAPPPPGASAMPLRLAYRAWDRAHDDLIAAYKAKKECAAVYQDVAGALALMKPQVPPEKAGKLQIYIDYYAGIHEKTKGFTALPDKTAEKDIVDELDVAARVIRKEFNPDK